MSTPQTKPHLLVIGGTGFIGFHLVLKAKERGWRVTSVSLNTPKRNRYVSGVKYLKADITNLKDLRKKLTNPFTYLVNLGGYVNHSNEKKNVNGAHFKAVINLTTIFTNKKIKKFIQIGSSSEYGESIAPQNEKAQCYPKSSYGLAKLASTEFLLMLNNINQYPVTVLRLFQAYGTQQDKNRVLPQIISGCLKNKKFPVSSGEQLRDFCFIDDITNAIFLSLKDKKSNGEVLNIASGKPIKIKNIIKHICKLTGKGKPQFGQIKYRKDENMRVYADIKKAKVKIKWKPKINFNRGIKVVIKSFS